MLSHLTEVPTKVKEAVALGWLDCLAVPPLQPRSESKVDPLQPAWELLLCAQSPLKVTNAVFDSSIRAPADGSVPVPPPGGVPPGGVPPGGVPPLGEVLPLGVLPPPLVLSPPLPPPQEASRPASNKTLTHVM